MDYKGKIPGNLYTPNTFRIFAVLLELKEVINQLSHFEISAHSQVSLARYSEMSELDQNRIYDSSYSYLSYLKEVLHSEFKSEKGGETPAQDRELLSRAFSFLHLKPPPSEDFAFLKQGWMIEIYSAEMTQIYRNFEFFRQCSYDYLTTLTIPWMELYQRDDQVTEKLISQIGQMLQHSNVRTAYDVPVHSLKERFLNHDLSFECDAKYMVPLFDIRTDKKVAFLHCIESRVEKNPAFSK